MSGTFEIKYGILWKYRGDEAHVAIPGEVTHIGDEAFEGCAALASVSIPEGVVAIGSGAFSGCKSLASVSIPEGVTEIGDEAFKYCMTLASASIPESVTRIGEGAFEYCATLASVSIPEGVTEIGEVAFSGCKALASIDIPEGMTQIGDWAFSGCKSLRSITIPESVTQIGNRTFAHCSGLASVCIPRGVMQIGKGAFADCSGLASVVIPESVTRIGNDAFDNSPATVVCPEGSYAHRHCEENRVPFIFDYQYEAFHGLLPQGFERLTSPFLADEEGPYVFVSYSHRDREQVLPVIKELYEAGWRVWYDEGLTIGDSYDETLEAHVKDCSAFLLFSTPNSLESAYIGINEVPWAVMYGKPIIECILEGDAHYPIRGGSAVAAVPPSDIGRALEQVEVLTRGERRVAKGITVVVDPVTREKSLDGYACCLYSDSGAVVAKAVMLEMHRAGCTLYDVVAEGLDEGRLTGCACLVAFLDRAFLGDEVLVKPLAEVYRVGGDVAVCALEDIEGVELPEGLSGLDKEHWLVYSHGISVDLNTQLVRHLQRLGCRDVAVLPGFEYKQDEEGIVIARYAGLDPSPRIEASYGGVPVVGIGDRAFEGCVHLREIAIPGSVKEIGEKAFGGCEALTSISIPEGVTRIESGMFSGCKSLASVSIPEGVTEIGEEAFSGCKALVSVEIPNSVTEIGNGMFSGCKSLASIDIPEGVTRIGEEAFYDCSALASVDIPEGVTHIEELAFSGCEALASVSIPEGVKEIGSWAFSGCKSLASIDISAGVMRIGDWAFLGCEALASVSIPDGMTEIRESAFENCSCLASVCIPESVTEIGNDAFFGCESLAVTCSQDSYAWSYCKDHGIPVGLNPPNRDSAMPSSSDDGSARSSSPSDDLAEPSRPSFFAKLFGSK